MPVDTAEGGSSLTDDLCGLWGPTPRADRVAAPAAALAAAREVDASARRTSTPVRKSFVRSDTEAAPPLSRLYQSGGRGGLVAIKLYLALLWRCSAAPYETRKPARAWATLLGLDDPGRNGQRRVNAALKTLREEGLVQVRHMPGAGNTVVLLDESGDRGAYKVPSNEWSRAPKGRAGDKQRTRNTYFKIPSRLWTEGDIQSLKGPGLVMLLILLAEQADTADSVWFSTKVFPARYRVSANTRAEGTQELRSRGLLSVTPEVLPEVPGSTFARLRRRNHYKLTLPGASEDTAPPTTRPASAEAAQETWPPKSPPGT